MGGNQAVAKAVAQTPPHSGRDARQQFNAAQVRTRLDGHAQPDIRESVAPIGGQVIHDAIRSLRQDEPVDRLTITNDGPGFLPPVIGAGVKKCDIEQVKTRTRRPACSAARFQR